MGNERKELCLGIENTIINSKSKIIRGNVITLLGGSLFFFYGNRISANAGIDSTPELIASAAIAVMISTIAFGINSMIEGHAQLTAATTAKLLRENLEHPRDYINRVSEP